jgi:hypothetical protein
MGSERYYIVGGKSIILLEGSQALSTCPSDRTSIKQGIIMGELI